MWPPDHYMAGFVAINVSSRPSMVATDGLAALLQVHGSSSIF